MKYRDQLRATSHAVVALQARTGRLATFRAAFGRRLSGATRTDLAATAVRLRAIAADLDELAAGPARADEIAALVAQARALGVLV